MEANFPSVLKSGKITSWGAAKAESGKSILGQYIQSGI